MSAGIVAIHLVGVVFCLILTLADRGLLINKNFSRFFYATAEWPFLLGIMTLFVCQLLMLYEISSDRVNRRSAVFGVMAKLLLCVTQVYVLLPAM